MKIKTLSVTEVNSYIKRILDNDFILNNLSIKGEISNLKYHSSGHIYFTLKDKESKINCIMFKGQAINLDFTLEEGMEVVIRGRASAYTVSGSFQIYCNDINKEGIGELHIKFEKLKNKLEKIGYFDEDNKKLIPKGISRVGIVTSETGAAIQDIKNVIRRRNSLIDIVLYPAQVQGVGAYKSIIEGIKYFNKHKTVDVLIIGRGGGSIEELWNFNEEELAKEIFSSNIPIISAVGHEIDFTISDFTSDLRAATPSQGAEMVSILESDLFNDINRYNEILNSYIINKLSIERKRLENLNEILKLKSPLNKIANSYIEIENIKEKLDYLIQSKINIEKERLLSLNDLLQAKNPLNILRKGYSIVNDINGNIIDSKEGISKSSEIKITLKDGYVKGDFLVKEKGGNF